jgi:hypothetical protein
MLQRATDPDPQSGQASPQLHPREELGRLHVPRGELRFPDLPRSCARRHDINNNLKNGKSGLRFAPGRLDFPRSKLMKTLQHLALALALSLYAIPAHAQTWCTSCNLDFTSISIVTHQSPLSFPAWFAIIGIAYGSSYGIQGIYSSQNQAVVQRCLALAEQVNLSRWIGSRPILRIQVQPDPAISGWAQIQYCTLYQ